MTRVCVIAAHPDDEILGCGGTIAWHAERGDTVRILILGEGAKARVKSKAARGAGVEIRALQKAARGAAQILGAKSVDFLGLPDNRMDTVALLDISQSIEKFFAKVAPTIVYTHHFGDLNIDHQITHRATVTACRPFPGQSIRALYTFETVSSTEWASGSSASMFVPARFVDVSAHLEQKMRALGCYRAEMRPFPHARSLENVEALARTRGATVGVTAAEAFGVIRETVS